jgi:spore coat protein CotF
VKSLETKFTAPEISNIWMQYIRQTMSVCVNTYVLSSVEDPDIRAIYQYALELSKEHLQTLNDWFKKENFPVPIGFTDDDVNLKAPPLFSDAYWLHYLHTMAMHGLTAYSLAISTSIRPELIKFYTDCNNESIKLYEKTLELLLSKGIYRYPPHIPTPENVHFVKSQNFLTGWFGERRPLNAIEINNIYFNLNKSIVSKALILGFSQAADLKEVRQIMMRGVDIGQKHIEIFTSLMNEDNLPSPTILDAEVTDSTISPFSDKLILFHIGYLFSVAVMYYGISLATCTRKDLALHHERVIMEDLAMAEDLVKIMIKHGWFEQTPQAEDRKELARI